LEDNKLGTIAVSKSKLKANMLQIFREIEASGETIIVTDHNKPVLKIVPIQEKRSVEEVFASWRGKAIIYEDLDLPTIEEWGDLAGKLEFGLETSRPGR
jgi:antitoxin (DNA-binding transcriptional repressor) of toxin-antitoxin stability system